jgi:integrase/recombinase XerD
MKWSFWIELYIRTHCVARGLRPLTLAAYEDALNQFHEWVRVTQADRAPDQLSAREVLAYLQHLREVRGNGDSAVNRAVVVLRRFYRAMVAMGYLDHAANPLNAFPSIKAVPRKLPRVLSSEQVRRLLAEPEADTVIGLRDRAILALFYGTGIRVSECASLRSGQVDLVQLTITVQGKGGHERAIPLNPELAECCAFMRKPAVPRFPVRHFSAHASDVCCPAAAFTNAYAPGASAAASVFRSHRIACGTPLQPTWYATGLAW